MDSDRHAAAHVNLLAGEVHIWYAAFDQHLHQLGQLKHSLSPDEQERLDHLAFVEHRDRFIIGRGGLRFILGRYLNAAPHTLRFGYAPHGKPFLMGQSLQFNLTHSQNFVCYAITRDLPVGVDLEVVREVTHIEQIVDAHFTAAEKIAWSRVSPAQKTPAFFRYWVRKEAFVKATGQGIKTANETAALADLSQTTVVDLESPPGYAAALAIVGDPPHGIKYLGWDDEVELL